MFKTILTATINSQTANNTLLLPLSLSYENARVFGIVSANKVDANILVEKINSELAATSDTTPTDEEFYHKMTGLVTAERKYRFPFALILVVMREGGEILILNWGGSAMIRRSGKVGQLTVMDPEKLSLEVKAGKLKKGDILALLNNNKEKSVEPIKENMETAKGWTDLVIFSQAYLAGPGLENTALLVLKTQDDEKVEEEEKTFESQAAKAEQRFYEDEGRNVNRAAEIASDDDDEDEEFDEDEDDDDEDDEEKGDKVTPWSMIGGFFKKKT